MVLAREVKTQRIEKVSETLSGLRKKDCQNGLLLSAKNKAWGMEAQ